MSYILDALKKADAERERGTVPGLHSQALGQVEDDDNSASKAIGPAVWVGAGVGISLIAVLSWQLLTREPAPVAGAQPLAATPDMAARMAPPAAPPQHASDLARNAVPYPPPPAPPSADDEPTRAMAPRAAPPLQTNNGKPTSAQAPGGARVPSINELPDDVKRDLPQLVIGGAMYSETPSSRMLIINSQVFHEGDQPYQGLVLEEIRLKSAVFKYRSYRYAINY
ncbi:MAG: hypothetical protein EPO09_04135 [Aquabacterium sp.]|uniref:general secretion pathway protein GspB n=1 Tax=Aquabacterium sp. TaxID=1872578 RepID=UPI00120A5CE2|nr:general secretion pathway protein GspB [Aquabacterium sp.]TAK97407.1 MAG: hypothetical protein EPO09_04135 [Aquabacterium sp.]